MTEAVLSQLYHGMPATLDLEPSTSRRSLAQSDEPLQPSSSMQGLAVLSELAEHELVLEELSGLVFSLQELRHSASAASAVQPKPQQQHSEPQLNSVDTQLASLTERLDQSELTWDALKSRCANVQGAPLVNAKISSLDSQFNAVRSDVELLRSELGEDKYLLVFHSVYQQGACTNLTLLKCRV